MTLTQTFTHEVYLNKKFSTSVEATNEFVAASMIVKKLKPTHSKIAHIGVQSLTVNRWFEFDESNFQILADELFRASPLSEGFDVEETNCEDNVFYFIDSESNVVKVTLDGLVDGQNCQKDTKFRFNLAIYYQ